MLFDSEVIRNNYVQSLLLVRNLGFANWIRCKLFKHIIAMCHCNWFEPRSISSSYSAIVRVKVVLKRLLLVTKNSSFQNHLHADDRTIQLHSNVCSTWMEEKRFQDKGNSTNQGIETQPNIDTLSLLVCMFYYAIVFSASVIVIVN